MDGPGLMDMVQGAARHASARHAHIARNIANADTPGYRATDLASFAETLGGDALGLRATRTGHLDPGPDGGRAPLIERSSEPAPNGNTVSLETEIMEATRVKAQHDLALSIYSGARDILRASLGRQ